MGWSWRRSAKVGPFRVNASSSGVSASVGVPGARVSVGPRGTYVHLRAGGLRYSHRLDGQKIPDVKPTRPPAVPLPAGRTTQTIESVAPGQILESSGDELLNEIREKQSKRGIMVVSVSVMLFGLLVFAVAERENWAASLRWTGAGLACVSALTMPWAAWFDRRSKLVYVRYLFDPLGEQIQEALQRMLTAFERTHSVWSIHTEQAHGDWKRNAGAETSVGRKLIHVGWGAPAFIKTNATVGFLNFGATKLYFFPDRILVLGGGDARAIPYTQLQMHAGQIPFIEDEAVPRDARVIRTTWRFVNKDGGPDRRFANNHQLPVALYGTLDISANSGFRAKLQTSSESLPTGAVEMLRLVQAALADMASRPPVALEANALPAFEDDPPPLFFPARRVVHSIRYAFSFHWLSLLPAWSVPIVYGIVFALPVVTSLMWAFGTRSRNATLFAASISVVAIASVLGLTGEIARSRRTLRSEAAATQRSRFKAVLMNELKQRPAAQFNFGALVSDEGIARREANAVADDIYQRVADRAVADGQISSAERTKLDALAKALELETARSQALEAEAKTKRYQAALDDAWADGKLTDEESRTLDELRWNLGLSR